LASNIVILPTLGDFSMIPLVNRRKTQLSLAFPSSVLQPIRNNLVATLRLAEIARAAAIFRVDEILVYLERDRPADRRLQRFVALILDYLATPQYIRKRAFGMSRDLRYAGALPPLRTPNQLVPASEGQVKLGDIREGIMTGIGPKATVDVGLGPEFSLDSPRSSLKLGTRGLFRLVNVEQRRVEAAEWDDLNVYWRYRVSAPTTSIRGVLGARNGWLKIGTSRYGDPLSGSEESLRRLANERGRALLVFGSPSHGLREILAEEKINVRDAFDLTLNTAIGQGVATVRTEEAVLISLSVLNEVLD